MLASRARTLLPWVAFGLSMVANALFAYSWLTRQWDRDEEGLPSPPLCTPSDGGPWQSMPFARALSRSAELDGCRVTLQGYLAYDGQHAALYATESDARATFRTNGLSLKFATVAPIAEGPATVDGTFRLSPSGLMSVGTLYVDHWLIEAFDSGVALDGGR